MRHIKCICFVGLSVRVLLTLHLGVYDDVIKWKYFPSYWSFCAGNSRITGEIPSRRPVTRSFAVFFYLRLNKRLTWNRDAGDLRRYRGHHDVTVMIWSIAIFMCPLWHIFMIIGCEMNTLMAQLKLYSIFSSKRVNKGVKFTTTLDQIMVLCRFDYSYWAVSYYCNMTLLHEF